MDVRPCRCGPCSSRCCMTNPGLNVTTCFAGTSTRRPSGDCEPCRRPVAESRRRRSCELQPALGCQRFQDGIQTLWTMGLLPRRPGRVDADRFDDFFLWHACRSAVLGTVPCGQGTPPPQTKPRFTAQTAAAVRSGISNFRRMFCMCSLTVSTLIFSENPISRLLKP